MTRSTCFFLFSSCACSSESLHTPSLWCHRRSGNPDTVKGQEKSCLLSHCLHNQRIFQWVVIQLPSWQSPCSQLPTNLILPSLPDVLLSYAFTIYEIVKLSDGEAVQPTSPQINTGSFLLYVFQVSIAINKPVLWIAAHLLVCKTSVICRGTRAGQAMAGPFLSASLVCVLVTRLNCSLP